ncbi:hypothetical protein TSUD_137290 [Trifolium subterraneum]|uniref:Aminotransferase-like plant mobile domain-containing protein n=1 Tax=Trifolium subterraneum TaxID=3900 RepID=A0A2Z6PJG0_TRISU|nr:hypothetical protein TSUD_137290 [Trifolium subterraneum]
MHEDIEHPVMQEDVVQHGWPGGPLDTSLLTRYSDHVARYIWFGQEHIEGPKPELQIASLGAKLTGWVPSPGEYHRNIQGWVDDSGLKWLERMSLSKVDPQLLSAITKRWHRETSSFHMSFGEMTITLDDVACLLHIPVRGVFYTPVPVSMEGDVALAAELLGVPYEEAFIHTSQQMGGSFTQQWLYDCAARAFSWASVTLVCLYDNLNDASMFATHALAEYPTLLQCWIHEYFPTLGRRGESVHRCDELSYPRTMRWMYKQGKTKLPAYRPIMDALTPSDVIWCPFEGHRGSILVDLVYFIWSNRYTFEGVHEFYRQSEKTTK